MQKAIIIAALILFSGCEQNAPQNQQNTQDSHQNATLPAGGRLAAVLAAQTEETQARYAFRNPEETLTFFGIEPGMHVVEILPGKGWYSQILVPYLGSEGILSGVDYAADMWPNFSFATEEFIQSRMEWPQKWTTDAKTWAGDDGAQASAYTFSTLPETLSGSADAVLFIRALHNLARFEDKGAYLTNALNESYRILKPGGTLGIVQHRAPEDKSNEWAGGQRGYLKTAFVISRMKQAGFEYIGASEVNANPKDQPGDDDIVWRLPPSLYTSKDNQALQNRFLAIGESDRMTLKFQKPLSDNQYGQSQDTKPIGIGASF